MRFPVGWIGKNHRSVIRLRSDRRTVDNLDRWKIAAEICKFRARRDALSLFTLVPLRLLDIRQADETFYVTLATLSGY
jgi:hypothetical protein